VTRAPVAIAPRGSPQGNTAAPQTRSANMATCIWSCTLITRSRKACTRDPGGHPRIPPVTGDVDAAFLLPSSLSADWIQPREHMTHRAHPPSRQPYQGGKPPGYIKVKDASLAAICWATIAASAPQVKARPSMCGRKKRSWCRVPRPRVGDLGSEAAGLLREIRGVVSGTSVVRSDGGIRRALAPGVEARAPRSMSVVRPRAHSPQAARRAGAAPGNSTSDSALMTRTKSG
jgi:hypothetical protein